MQEYPLLSDEELENKKEFESLSAALANPDEAFMLNLIETRYTAEELSDAFARLPRLQILSIEGIPSLDVLPREISNLKNLQFLNVTSCGIKEIPVEIGQLPNLTDLIFRDLKFYNGIFPNFLCDMPQLISLDFGDCDLQEIPDCIGNLTELEDFHVDGNQLDQLPASIGKLTKLLRISFYGNYAMHLPKEFLQLKQLEEVHHGRMEVDRKTVIIAQEAMPGTKFEMITTGDPIKKQD